MLNVSEWASDYVMRALTISNSIDKRSVDGLRKHSRVTRLLGGAGVTLASLPGRVPARTVRSGPGLVKYGEYCCVAGAFFGTTVFVTAGDRVSAYREAARLGRVLDQIADTCDKEQSPDALAFFRLAALGGDDPILVGVVVDTEMPLMIDFLREIFEL